MVYHFYKLINIMINMKLVRQHANIGEWKKKLWVDKLGTKKINIKQRS